MDEIRFFLSKSIQTEFFPYDIWRIFYSFCRIIPIIRQENISFVLFTNIFVKFLLLSYPFQIIQLKTLKLEMTEISYANFPIQNQMLSFLQWVQEVIIF